MKSKSGLVRLPELDIQEHCVHCCECGRLPAHTAVTWHGNGRPLKNRLKEEGYRPSECGSHIHWCYWCDDCLVRAGLEW